MKKVLLKEKNWQTNQGVGNELVVFFLVKASSFRFFFYLYLVFNYCYGAFHFFASLAVAKNIVQPLSTGFLQHYYRKFVFSLRFLVNNLKRPPV
jgi:hypothetical protein